MDKIVYTCCLLMFISTSASSQNTEKLKPVSSPAGVYLRVGTLPLKGENGLVERNSGQGFEVIGYLTAPANKAVLYQRMQDYSLRFPNYYTVTENLAATLTQLVQNGKKDSILKTDIPVTLLGLGAAFLDTAQNLPEGTIYRVTIGTQKWESEPLAKKPMDARIKQVKFYKLDAFAQAIRAEWRLKNNQQPPLLEVFRKKAGIDSNFTKIRTDLGFEGTPKGDSLSVHLSDTTVLPGITYMYFLSGKDYLGRTITRSDTLRSIAGNRTTVNGINKFVTKTAADSSGIQLTWNKQTSYTIRSIRVLRSAYYDGTYVQVAVLSPADTTWVDRSVAIGANYYYQLFAQGEGDFAFPSPRIFGSLMNDKRILAPTALRVAKIDSGAVLNWKYNTYMNLLGFRMYRAKGNTGQFKAISDVITAPRDTLVFSFKDQDPSLNVGELYTYAVAAISRSYQESPLSDIASYNFTGKSKLTAPTHLRNILLNDSTTSITWQDMAETDKMIAGYLVYRKAIGAGNLTGHAANSTVETENLTIGSDNSAISNNSLKGFKKLTSSPITKGNEFVDSPGIGTAWQYVVRSVNETDSSVYSLPTVVRFYAGKPLSPARVQLFAQKNSVIINWDATMIPGVTKYHIYRATSSTTPTQIGTVAVNQPTTFEDKGLPKENLFYYYVTTETTEKIESDKSREVSVRLRR